MLDRLAPVAGSLPPYFTQTRANSLDCLGIGHGLGLGEEVQPERAAEHDRADVVAQADGDSVLVAGSELADDACCRSCRPG